MLPTLISLAISGSYVFADEPAPEVISAPTITESSPPPVVTPPAINPDMEKYREDIEKRMAEQQAAIEKRMAEQQDIIKKQIEQQQKQHQEMMEKRNANMQEMMEKRNAKIQEMQKLMEQSRNSKSPEDYQHTMDKMQEMHGRNEVAPPPPPAWGNRGPVVAPPNWNVPYAQPRGNYYRPTPNFAPIPNGEHHVEVDQSLKNIEKLLQEVIDILQKK